MNGTVIYFDYGGYYSDDGDNVRWNRKESHVYSVNHKGSTEELTYSWLVSRICKKVMLDEATTKLKISYIPMHMDPIRQSYIMDDEDVDGYLMQSCNERSRCVLHVEVSETASVNQNWEQPVVGGSRFNIRSEELTSEARASQAIVALHSGCEPWERVASEVDVSVHSGWRPWEHYEYVDFVPDILNGEDIERDEDGRHDDDGRRDDDYDGIRDDEMPEESFETEWDDGLNLTLGQQFRTKHEVMDIVERGLHKNCFNVNVIKSTTTLYVVKCRGSNCKWALRVAKLKYSDLFSVRTYTKIHTCSRTSTSTSRGQRRGTPGLVASILQEDFAGRFDTPPPKSIVSLVQGRAGVKVSYATAWRGKQKAANKVRGSPEESYMILPSYFYMLEQVNRGSVTRVELDEHGVFKYAFFALGACISGFEAMRKVVVVDGTHLNGLYGGVLIIASCQDPEKHHYPIAFAVVDGEKDASWRWFFRTLQTIIPDNPELVFVSDRHQSIIKTVREVYPMSHHGFCVWHLSQNVKSHVYGANKDEVAANFIACAYAYSESEFNILYDAFKGRYPKAALYLEESLDVRQWARCHFPRERYNLCTSNTVENLNGLFKFARKLSLVPMFDMIIDTLIAWHNKHRKDSAKVCAAQKLVPRVESKLHNDFPVAKLLTVTELNTFLLEYSVLGRDGKWYLVNLREKTCACKHFDIDKYPCVHALAAIMYYAKSEDFEDINVHNFCSKYYLLLEWISAYGKTIYQVPDRDDWNVPEDIKKIVPIPPQQVVKKGRKKVKRYPSVGEKR